MFITEQLLQNKGACDAYLRAFKKLFPDGIEIPDRITKESYDNFKERKDILTLESARWLITILGISVEISLLAELPPYLGETNLSDDELKIIFLNYINNDSLTEDELMEETNWVWISSHQFGFEFNYKDEEYLFVPDDKYEDYKEEVFQEFFDAIGMPNLHIEEYLESTYDNIKIPKGLSMLSYFEFDKEKYIQDALMSGCLGQYNSEVNGSEDWINDGGGFYIYKMN